MSTITLENPRLAKYLEDKELLVTEGRNMSLEIEKIENKIVSFENKEKAITGKIRPSKEVEEKGDLLAQDINLKIKELEQLGKEIEDEKLKAVPEEMKQAHLALLKDKEKMERDRNKIALKIQKIKDKLIPIVQKEVTPLLKDEYDDIETAKLKNGKVIIETFNHLTDWKSKFKKR